NALSTLAQHAVFVRMRDSIARRQQRADDLTSRLAQSQSRLLRSHLRRLDALEARLRRHDLRVRTGVMRRQLDGQTTKLNAAISRLLAAHRGELDRLSAAVRSASVTLLLRKRSRWEQVHSGLAALSPTAILARGYALVFDDKGNLVKQAAQLNAGERVRTQLAHGEFTARVEQIHDKDNLRSR
ncbi:MAG TPA: exodeoxyribonuclease VII large subunit, partial [Terriglobales bacterium]|nr:exodeoxyribonuclease VII large subunit [Terriglobales bacterium]